MAVSEGNLRAYSNCKFISVQVFETSVLMKPSPSASEQHLGFLSLFQQLMSVVAVICVLKLSNHCQHGQQTTNGFDEFVTCYATILISVQMLFHILELATAWVLRKFSIMPSSSRSNYIFGVPGNLGVNVLINDGRSVSTTAGQLHIMHF